MSDKQEFIATATKERDNSSFVPLGDEVFLCVDGVMFVFIDNAPSMQMGFKVKAGKKYKVAIEEVDG